MDSVRIKSLVVPTVIYPYSLLFSFEQSDDQLRSVLRKHGLVWNDGLMINGSGKCFMMHADLWCCIRLKKYPNNAFDQSVLAHEILHAVAGILRDIGISLCEESEEAFTYLVGYITQEVYKFL